MKKDRCARLEGEAKAMMLALVMEDAPVIMMLGGIVATMQNSKNKTEKSIGDEMHSRMDDKLKALFKKELD